MVSDLHQYLQINIPSPQGSSHSACLMIGASFSWGIGVSVDFSREMLCFPEEVQSPYFFPVRSSLMPGVVCCTAGQIFLAAQYTIPGIRQKQ